MTTKYTKTKRYKKPIPVITLDLLDTVLSASNQLAVALLQLQATQAITNK